MGAQFKLGRIAEAPGATLREARTRRDGKIGKQVEDLESGLHA